MHLLFPDGRAPAFGDADDARGLWVRRDGATDYLGLLSLGAVLFGRGDFKEASGQAGEEVLWLFGSKGLEAFDALASRPRTPASTAYPEAGYFVMRNGWDPQDGMLLFDCGEHGYGPAGHGHSDALSFQLYALGYPFLVDAGTFSYNLDYAWRDAFRGTRAHNTVAVDGQEQSVPRDRMSWESVAHARVRTWRSTRWFDLADGEHDGFGRLTDPVTHRRAIVYLKPDVWIVFDRLSARERHEYEALFHVRPDCVVQLAPDRLSAALVSPHGRTLDIRAVTGGGPAAGFVVAEGTERERAAWFSPAYGVRLPSRMLSHSMTAAGGATFVTSFVSCRQTHPTVTHLSGRLAAHVGRDGGIEDYFHYCPDASPGTDDGPVRFDGRLLYARTVGDRILCAWAADFRQVVIDRGLQVSAQGTVKSLVLADGVCEIAVADQGASTLSVRLPKGVRLKVNGDLQRDASASPLLQ